MARTPVPTDRVEATGPKTIYDAGVRVRELIEDGHDQFGAVHEVVADITRNYRYTHEFVEDVVFFDAITDIYDVGGAYESEQVTSAFYDTDPDWRSIVNYAWGGVLFAAVESEAEDPHDESSMPDTIVHEFAKPLDEWADEYVARIVDAVERGDDFFEEMEVLTEEASYVDALSVMHYLSEEYGLGTWRGITDTSVREDIAYANDWRQGALDAFLWDLTYHIVRIELGEEFVEEAL